jgi:hypothetical protein
LAREYKGSDELLRVQREIALGIARWQLLAEHYDARRDLHQVIAYIFLTAAVLFCAVVGYCFLVELERAVQHISIVVLAILLAMFWIFGHYWLRCLLLRLQLYMGDSPGNHNFKKRVERILRTRPLEVSRQEHSALLRMRGALEVKEPKLAWMGCVEELKGCLSLPNLIYWYELGEFLSLLQTRKTEGFSSPTIAQ